jgi:cytochrome P450
MCIGSHLAQLEMKAVLACVSANFQTEVHNDSGIAQADGYTVGPKGGRLGLTFKRRTA